MDDDEKSGLVLMIEKEKPFLAELKKAESVDLNYCWKLKPKYSAEKVFVEVGCNDMSLTYLLDVFYTGQFENSEGLHRSLFFNNPQQARIMLLKKAEEIHSYLLALSVKRIPKKKRYFGYYLRGHPNQQYFGDLLKRRSG